MIQFLQALFKSRWPHKKIKVYALVGRSGSGKSFRSKLITEKYNIDLIIDDGLLIQGHRIIAGKSAKRENNRFRAVKRAIFEDLDHAREVRSAMSKVDFKSILIIGTSDKMIGMITERLYLSFPDQVIRIEDIATADEIARARESRKKHGKHVIPVPMIEVKTDPAHRIIDSVRIFTRKHPVFFWKKKEVEKTIVQPEFSRKGRLSISDSALSQMIMHCISEYDSEFHIDRIVIDESHHDYRIEVCLCFPFGKNIPENLSSLQEYVVSNVARHSGLHLTELHLTVSRIDS